MNISQHQLEGEKSIFVRFKHGFKLFVKNNIKEQLQIVIAELKENPEHNVVFKTLIKDMREFSMLGVHPDSTWKTLSDRKSTRLNSSHQIISYAVFCLKKKKKTK